MGQQKKALAPLAGGNEGQSKQSHLRLYTNPAALPTALEHAARGWLVFPAPASGEKKGLKSAQYSGGRRWGATTDPDEIKRDWQQWPSANVGIVTGPESGIFVLDLDCKDGVDGVQWMADRIEEHGLLPDTVEAMSPSGGWHVYFRYPDFEVKTCAGEIAPGVDVRGAGGMVLGVPSVKPGVGAYHWKNPPPMFEVADAPQWVLDLLPRKDAPKPAPEPATGDVWDGVAFTDEGEVHEALFPGSVAGAMGGQIINVGSGAVEWPVTTSSVTAGWQATELGNVAGPTKFTTGDKSLSPKQTLGVTMKISRKSMMQSGQALEAAIRRDMSGTMAAELDKGIFLGSGASGQPNGIIAKANATYSITETGVNDVASWEAIKAAVVDFMTANAASGPGSVRMLCRPELWAFLDGAEAFKNTGITEWARVAGALGSVTQSANAVADPTSGTPDKTQALLATAAGVAPFFVGLWGGLDLIRDPYSDAQSGGLRITALATMDIAVARPAQLRVLTGLALGAGS